MRKTTTTLTLIAASAFTLALAAAPVRAQDEDTSYSGDEETISITAARPRLDTQHPGIPTERVSLSAEVPYGDLDLATYRGERILRDRIRGAASDICRDLEAMYPPLEGETRACYRQAVANGMREADDLVTYTRSYAGND